jgi:mannose-1-phosphate guanylyltransferase
MKAFILAAGLGTRLRPLTEKVAKPSLPLLGVPTLWFPAWQIRGQLGIDSFMVNASHAPETIRQAANDEILSRFTGIRFQVSDESKELLGTSGALKKIEPWIAGETLVVSNGDVVSDFDLSKMLKFHQSKKSKLTLHLRAFDGGDEKYADIKCTKDGVVLELGPKKEKGVMFSGCYIIEPELLKKLPKGFSDLRPALLEPLAKDGALFTYREDCEWLDTGSLSSYAKANFEILKKIPSSRKLIELKMQEPSNGVWLPKEWAGFEKIRFHPPVMLQGRLEEWMAASMFYGPNFLGLKPPEKKPGVFKNTLMHSSFTSKL